MTPFTFILVFVIIGFVVWAWLQSKRCVSCGAYHLGEDEIYRCEKCHRPVCKDKVGIRETNSSFQRGLLTSTYSSGSNERSQGNVCSILVHELANQGETCYYPCKEHSRECEINLNDYLLF